jgi:pimeloyl-ACP methyl ester carboxylesterase
MNWEEKIKFDYAQIGGVKLHYATAGEGEKLVILLHGFPEFWYGWRRQIAHLAEAGCRVWVPDQRGYNRSDKPKGIGAYRIDTLAADVRGLIDANGREKAVIVGHDWGGAVAWELAATAPERVERLVVLNCPHGGVFSRHLRRNPAQRRRSAYIFFFQLPWLPELSGRAFRWRVVTRAMTGTSRPGTFTPEDIARYRAAWSEPGAFTAMLNWYRAALQQMPPAAAVPSRIGVPTLLIWGAKDRFLGREMVAPSIKRCADGRLVFIEEAGHWVQHEEPARVNSLLTTFLQR